MPSLPSQVLSPESEIGDPLQASRAPRPIASPRIQETAASSAVGRNGFTARPLRGDLLIRQAVLLQICDYSPQQIVYFESLTLNQWMRLLRWLDYSGLALYFLDRLSEVGREDLLPTPVHTRLHQRLCDNTKRTQGMTAESNRNPAAVSGIARSLCDSQGTISLAEFGAKG